MRQLLNRIVPSFELLLNHEVKKTLPASCSVVQRRHRSFFQSKQGRPPLNTHPTKEWAHKWYKWNYEELPKQTAEDVMNPQFAIRPPAFKLPKRKVGLSRRSWRQRIADVAAARQDLSLEKLARHRQLMISVDDVENEWQEEYGFDDVNNVAKFYGINRDLFDNKDVNVETWLDIEFGSLKIHRGNIVTPSEMLSLPSVSFNAIDECFTTLVLSNLDGHPLDSSKEILHWVVGNIPGNSIYEGETIINYLAPLPWKGTGFHRFVFTLYKHSSPFNYSNIGDGSTLDSRTVASSDITLALNMTPVGLAFCQLQWDSSVTNTCVSLSDVSGEPIFDFEEYIEPKEELKQLKMQAKELQFRNM